MRPRIDITFHDTAKACRFVVMTRHFDATEQARATFDSLSQVDGFTVFVASMQISEGKFEHLPLDAQLVEHLGGRSLPELLARARARKPIVIGTPAKLQ